MKRYDATEVVGVISRSVERQDIQSRPQIKRRVEVEDAEKAQRNYTRLGVTSTALFHLITSQGRQKTDAYSDGQRH